MGSNLIGTIGSKNIIGTLGSGHIVMGKNVIPDWNQNDPQAEDYIKNRPGGYDIPSTVDISWDGDMTGKETFQSGRPVDGFTMYFCKITDNVPPIESFYTSNEHGEPITEVQVVTASYQTDGTIKEFVENFPFDDNSSEGYYSAGGHNYIFVTSESVTIDKRTYSKGIWCFTVVKNNVTTQYVKRITTVNNKVSVRLPYSFAPTQVIEAVNAGAKKKDPEFTGSFSQNRLKDSSVGYYSHAECADNIASGNYSHAEGNHTIAQGFCQHVEGAFNIASKSEYVHIVGNGSNNNTRSNAYTLTWDGVPWSKGRPKFGGTSMNSSSSQSVMANGDKELIVQSSSSDSTKKFKITVDDTGTPSFTNTGDATNKFTPVTPSELAEKQDALTDADKQSITKTGMTSGAAWTAAEQKAARERMGIPGNAELLHSITVGEGGVNQVNIPAFPSLSRIVAGVTIPKIASQFPLFMLTNIDEDKRYIAGTYYGLPDEISSVRFEIKIDAGLVYAESSGSGRDWGGANIIGANNAGDFMAASAIISALFYTPGDGNIIPAGTTINVYGVKT